MKMRKRRGPRTDPWGTPLETGIEGEYAFPTLTRKVRMEMKDASQANVRPVMPASFRAEMSKGWGILSKALERSK